MAKVLVGTSGLALLLIAVTTMLFWRAGEIEDAIETSWETREEAHRLAYELRQSSDDLTRMARTFAVTGDEQYRGYFQEILDIRNGDAPRPDDYHLVYWDLVTADGERPRASGQAVTLRSLMEDAGITAGELALLTTAEDESNLLTKLENQAFAAVADGKREVAQEILHTADYHQAKAQIMLPLLHFFEAIDGRTAAHVAELLQRRQDLNRYMLAAIVTLLGIDGGFVGARLRRKPQRSARGRGLKPTRICLRALSSGPRQTRTPDRPARPPPTSASANQSQPPRSRNRTRRRRAAASAAPGRRPA